MRRPLIGLAIVALAFPLLAACGSDGNTSEPNADSTTTASAPASTSSGDKDCLETGAKIPTANPKYGTDPDISKPTGEPPCELVVKDLTVGKGDAVKDITTEYDWNYEGVAWSNGEVFDSSFQRGAPIAFPLGQVITGWTDGLQGMKPGGRRMLVIPSDQAYGEAGNAGIAPGETLVFVVDLVGPTS